MSNNKNKNFIKSEKEFNNKKELQQYLVDSLKKCKKLNFNLKKVVLTD
jgi:hypothetical protein